MDQKIHYAGFWLRVLADCVDSIILDTITALFGLMLLGIVYWIKVLFIAHSSSESLSFFSAIHPFYLQILFIIVRGAISFVYFTYLTFIYGTTLGKRIFKIYIVDFQSYSNINFKQSMIRCLSYLISYLPLGAGFLMIAFQPEKRGLHDLIAGTCAIIRNPEKNS